LVEQGAARRVTDAPTLAADVLRFLESTELRRSAGRHGRELVDRNRGAVGRVISLLAPYLE
jgi:3-deoxy-D-manno-octulosonic-acid transferase